MLRNYQQMAVDQTLGHISSGKNPLIVMPTGSGKSFVIAALAEEFVKNRSRVLILAHRKELLVQNYEKILMAMRNPEDLFPTKIGLHSAGLSRRSILEDIVVGGIQTCWKASDLLLKGRKYLIVDECHRIGKDSGMYCEVIGRCQEINGRSPVLIGLTATPFRKKEGKIIDLEWFDVQIEPTTVNKLIDLGFLSKPIFYGVPKLNFDGVRTVSGDYDAKEAQIRLDPYMQDIVEKIRNFHDAQSYRKILVFCQSIVQAKTLLSMMPELPVEILTGETDSKERDLIVKSFRTGGISILLNVQMLIEGFDVADVDCIFLARATKSKVFYEQMVGRGLRVSPEKNSVTIMDYGDNARRHGPLGMYIDKEFRIYGGAKGSKEQKGKICESCNTVNPPQSALCSNCGAYFSPVLMETKFRWNGNADIGIHDVFCVWISSHIKSGEFIASSIKIVYGLDDGLSATEWLPIFSKNEWAKNMAIKQWNKRRKVGTAVLETKDLTESTMDEIVTRAKEELVIPKKIEILPGKNGFTKIKVLLDKQLQFPYKGEMHV